MIRANNLIKYPFIGALIVSSISASAVTIRLSPASSDSLVMDSRQPQTKNSAIQVSNQNSEDKIDSLETVSIVDSLDANKMQGEINMLTDELRKERNSSAIRGSTNMNEVFIGNWHLDATKTLMQNMQDWVQQAKVGTGRDIKLLWEAPGPGEFKVSYNFEGSWSEAFMSLGHAIEKTKGWPVRIDVNTRMNIVKVSAIQ